jgi:hypothetical protein
MKKKHLSDHENKFYLYSALLCNIELYALNLLK